MGRRIGMLFGGEDTFSWALIDAVNGRTPAAVEAEPVRLGALRDDGACRYDLILDRVSHKVPFYRTFLKQAVYRGARVINNPFCRLADDRFFGSLVARSLGVSVPRTVLLPHKNHPAGTAAETYRNLTHVDWEEVFGYLGFPILLKPACGGGPEDIYRCENPQAFFSAYDRTRDLCMMAQQAIEFTEYYRCYVFGRERVRVMRCEPQRPGRLRYHQNSAPAWPVLHARMVLDALGICKALGCDMNAVEFAVRDGVPYAVDLMDWAPEADPGALGPESFQWAVVNMTDVLIEAVWNPREFETAGAWPSLRETV